MSKFTSKISPEVSEALESATFQNGGIYLGAPGTMEKKLYKAVCTVLESEGVKWDRKAGLHKHPSGNTEEIVRNLLGAGEIRNERAEFQYFPTVPEVGHRMCEALFHNTEKVSTKHKCLLEPSAGEGHLVRAARDYGYEGQVVACELQEKFAPALSNEELEIGLLNCPKDFLDMEVSPKSVEFILMNPPFAQKRDHKHVQRAIEYLMDGGVLVCLVSQTCKTDWDGVKVELIEDQVIAGTKTQARSKMLRITRQWF